VGRAVQEHGGDILGTLADIIQPRTIETLDFDD